MSGRAVKKMRLKIGRPYSVDQMLVVIYLRFGSLESDRSPWHSAREVFERMGIKDGAQHNIIKRWKERGFKVESRLSDRGKAKMLTEEQQLWIVNPETLKQQSHLPLRLRAEIIRRRFHLKGFDPVTLRQYYLRLGVKYRRPHYDYQQKHRRAEEIQG